MGINSLNTPIAGAMAIVKTLGTISVNRTGRFTATAILGVVALIATIGIASAESPHRPNYSGYEWPSSVASVTLHWDRVTGFNDNYEIAGYIGGARVETHPFHNTEMETENPTVQYSGKDERIVSEVDLTPEEMLESIRSSYAVRSTREQALDDARKIASMGLGFRAHSVDSREGHYVFNKSGDPVNTKTVSDNINSAAYYATWVHVYHVVVHAEMCVTVALDNGVSVTRLIHVRGQSINFAEDATLYETSLQSLENLERNIEEKISIYSNGEYSEWRLNWMFNRVVRTCDPAGPLG